MGEEWGRVRCWRGKRPGRDEWAESGVRLRRSFWISQIQLPPARLVPAALLSASQPVASAKIVLLFLPAPGHSPDAHILFAATPLNRLCPRWTAISWRERGHHQCCQICRNKFPKPVTKRNANPSPPRQFIVRKAESQACLLDSAWLTVNCLVGRLG